MRRSVRRACEAKKESGDCVVRGSFVSYGLSSVCVLSVCLHVVRGSGRMDRTARSRLLFEKEEGERRVSFSDDTFLSINFQEFG